MICGSRWRRRLDRHLDDRDLDDPRDREVFGRSVTRLARDIAEHESFEEEDRREPQAAGAEV
jgi:hypothetical protein